VIITPKPLVGWGVFILYGKVSKLSITFILCIFSDSTPFSVNRVSRDHCQSKSEVVSKVLPLVHCIPVVITSSLFIGFECMSSEWKFKKVSYEFGIMSFLR
jgi:hypothetical protein